MNGPFAFGDSSCSRRAIISLPVPLSPWTRTVVASLATLRTRSITWRITALVPVTKSPTRLASATTAASDSTLRLRSCFSLALRTRERSASYSKSLVMKW